MAFEEFSEQEIQQYVYPVIRLYEGVFGRRPDLDGLKFWVNVYKSIMEQNPGNSADHNLIWALSDWLKPTMIIDGQTVITEFGVRYGLNPSNQVFVELLYNAILGRGSDTAGQIYWIEALNENLVTREQLVVAFTQSTEFKLRSDPYIDAFLQRIAAETETFEGSLFATYPPTAVDDAITISEDDDPTDILADMLSNDSDPDPSDTLSVVSVDTTGTKGTVTLGSVIYDPDGKFEHLQEGDSETDTFTYTISDGNGGTDTATVTITVEGANDAPEITSPDAFVVPENFKAVASLTSEDPDDEDTATFEITGGADAALFEISADGDLSFIDFQDKEAPADDNGDNVYEVTVKVTDSLGESSTQDIAVTVAGVNEFPIITSDGGEAIAAVNAAENQTAVTNVETTDPEGDTEGSGLRYAITGGADGTLFNVDFDTGVLSFNTAPDFETKTDKNGDGVYEVQVTVKDSAGLTDVQDISVTVTNVNEAPAITSNGGGDVAAVNVAENQTAVTDVQSLDPEGETEGSNLAYSITGGADAGLFSIIATTGVLTFKTAPDFETKTDVGANGVYDVQVTVKDSGDLLDVQNLAITVTDVEDAPSSTDDTLAVPEDTPTTLTAGDFGTFVADANTTGGLSLKAVQITTLPANGVLTLDGVAVIANQEILVSDFSVGAGLVYTPAKNDDTDESLSFRVIDQEDRTSASSYILTLDIIPENDAPVLANLASGPDIALGTQSGGVNQVIQPFTDPNNLAASADVFVSSTIPGFPQHVKAGITDSTFGNGSAWIADTGDVWFKIDLGGLVSFNQVAFGRDRTNISDDRDPGPYQIWVADIDAVLADGDDADDGTEYAKVFDSTDVSFDGIIDLDETIVSIFESVEARYVKIVFTAPPGSQPAIDEVQIYESVVSTPGNGAVLLDIGSDAAVTDPDSSDFNGGILTVSLDTAVADEDVLGIEDQGTGAGEIGVSGANVTYGGALIGTFAGGSSGANLVVTLNTSANDAAVEALLQALTYENTDDIAPDQTMRGVDITLTDGDGGTSNTIEIDIYITDPIPT